MIVYWYRMFIGGLCLTMIFCQDNNPLSIDNEPEEKVILYIDSGVNTAISQKSTAELLACYECTNCRSQSKSTIRHCDYDITMCYTSKRRINKTHEIINQGCSASKEQCTVPNDNSLNGFDTITCCTSSHCNQSSRFQVSFGIFLLNLFFLTMYF